MRAVVQRVIRAMVNIAGVRHSAIGPGMLVLLGVARDDSESDAEFMADRIVGMRIFADAEGKMNLALGQIGGSMLVVSQFTLLADTSHGRRPSFAKAAGPDDAQRLYRYFIERVRTRGIHTAEGEFGAMMQVELVNDGPVTIMLDSREK
jgi:D-tyrosyl-tRNA(Tyr) deacylase